MKKLIVLFTLFYLSAQSQDTIRFRNGEIKAVKVSEIGISEIHYSRFDNLEGPKYIVTKNEVQFIKYAGGQVDSFALVRSPEVVVTESEKEFKPKPSYKQCDKFEISGGKIFCNHVALGESRLLKVISATEDNKKRNEMMQAYTSMKKHKKQQYLFGFVGLGVGVGVAYFGFVGAVLSGEVAPLAIGAIAGITIGTTGAIISSIHKTKRQVKKLEIAKIYNSN